MPELKEQQIIVRQLGALRAETQKLEAVYQKKMDDLEELKKSILQKAFRGELVEPAGDLPVRQSGLETSVSSIAAKYEIDSEISMASEPTKNQL
jgi:hypothetical protein